MSKVYCNHCGSIITDTPSESGPSVIRDGESVYCNTFCYVGKTDKIKPKVNALSRAIGFLGGNKVDSVIHDTIDKVNKCKGF